MTSRSRSRVCQEIGCFASAHVRATSSGERASLPSLWDARDRTLTRSPSCMASSRDLNSCAESPPGRYRVPVNGGRETSTKRLATLARAAEPTSCAAHPQFERTWSFDNHRDLFRVTDSHFRISQQIRNALEYEQGPLEVSCGIACHGLGSRPQNCDALTR